MTDGETGERDQRVGGQVDRYTIVRLLGRGGMGAVYEARHTRLARRVAIKFLLPELAARPEILRRFENEAVAAGGLEHPNLVAVTDLGRAPDGAPYLVMEFLQGEDCAALLRRLGPLPAARAVNLVLQACRGVAVAHDGGIIHRDLKPENLFVIDGGDGSDQLKVLDFGIAKLRPEVGQAATRTGSTFGTTHYMSPEQARGAGEVDQRADVWSLGVVLYELLAGRRPFEADQPLGVVHQILNATPPALDSLRPGLPRGLAAALEKAMRKDAGERTPTVRALAAALAPFAGRPELEAGAPTRPTPATAAEPPTRRRASGPVVGTALALAGVVVGIVIASTFRERGKPVPAAPAAPAPVAAAPPPAPASPPPELAKVSEPSGQSEHAEHAEHAAPAEIPRVARKTRSREAAPPPALKLDPNPY